jgi:hypothetical protein
MTNMACLIYLSREIDGTWKVAACVEEANKSDEAGQTYCEEVCVVSCLAHGAHLYPFLMNW